MLHVALTSGPNLTMERIYRADIADVWALWTTKDGFESWWGPEGFRVEVAVLEAWQGGRLHYDMIADAPEMIEAMRASGQPIRHNTHGQFSELEPQSRLVLTHTIDFLPGVVPYDNHCEVELFQLGAWCKMVVRVQPYHDAMFTSMAVEGWTSQLRKLDARWERKLAD